jgi:ribosomal protein S18 acetylase RimI-like enzyme
MTVTRDELIAIEAAAVRGWPALVTSDIDGWTARWSSGGSVRANSVATVAFHGDSIDGALAEVAEFYRSRGSVPKFTVSQTSEPPGLDELLAARGWQRSGAHVTMAKRIEAPAERAPASAAAGVGVGVERHEAPGEAWYSVYLQGLTEDRRGVARTLVEGVPAPRCFFACKRGGEVIASGLSVIDGTLASVQCMATHPAARRSGAATAVLSAIQAHAREHAARLVYLQTDAENRAAIGLYERFGFTLVDRYHTRVLDR